MRLCGQKQNCELDRLSKACYCAEKIVVAINAGAVSVTVSVSLKARTSPEQSSISSTVASKFSHLEKVAAAGCIPHRLFEVLDSDADEEVDEFNLMVDFGAKEKRQNWLEMKNDNIVILDPIGDSDMLKLFRTGLVEARNNWQEVGVIADDLFQKFRNSEEPKR